MITVTSKSTNATKEFIQRALHMSSGAKPIMNVPINGDLVAALAKLDKWEADLVAAVNEGASKAQAE